MPSSFLVTPQELSKQQESDNKSNMQNLWIGLPVDMWCIVCDFLLAPDIIAVLRVSKTLFSLLDRHSSLPLQYRWKELLAKRDWSFEGVSDSERDCVVEATTSPYSSSTSADLIPTTTPFSSSSFSSIITTISSRPPLLPSSSSSPPPCPFKVAYLQLMKLVHLRMKSTQKRRLERERLRRVDNWRESGPGFRRLPQVYNTSCSFFS